MLTPENIISRYDQLRSNKTPFETVWDDCITYVYPFSPHLYNEPEYKDVGDKDLENYDATAEIATRNLASVIMTTTTPPDQKWINLVNSAPGADKDDDEVNEYIDNIEYSVMDAINNSNFYSVKYEFDRARVVFGTSIMFIDAGRGIRDLNFKHIPVHNVCIAENSDGYVDTLIRKVKITARELVQKFGLENMSEKTKTVYDNSPFDKVEVMHAVYPRSDDERDVDSETGEFLTDNKNMPFAEMWLEVGTKHKIQELGYREFPYIVARWEKIAGLVWGHSPVIDTMPDIKMLNRMKRSLIRLAERVSDPPKLIVGGERDDINYTPGKTNHLDEGVEIHDLITGANYPVTHNMVEETQNAVKEALYVLQFQSLDQRTNKEMTATEVEALKMEALRILAPVLGRNQPEIMQPLLARTLDILYTNGKIKENREDVLLALRHSNDLTRAMKMSEINAIRGVLLQVGQLAQADPSVMDVYDLDQVVMLLNDASGIPARVVRSEAEIKAIREQRAQQQAQQQQIQQVAIATEIDESKAKAEEKRSRATKNVAETYGTV